jgi:hypothetical protein
MKDLKIRCSAIGKIMTSPRSKGEVLSATTKTYIKELVLEHKYGIKKEINSRYLDKGNQVEDMAIELAEQALDLGFVFKNELYFENDHLTGTPDIITDTLIVDVKSSWNGTTFPMFEDELPNKDYYWQLQGYMELTGKHNAIVAYCLVDTPEDIVLDEIRRVAWAKKELEPSEETEQDVRSQHEFNHIPKDKRVKAFLVEKDEHAIWQIKERVEQCREYYTELWNK